MTENMESYCEKRRFLGQKKRKQIIVEVNRILTFCFWLSANSLISMSLEIKSYRMQQLWKKLISRISFFWMLSCYFVLSHFFWTFPTRSVTHFFAIILTCSTSSFDSIFLHTFTPFCISFAFWHFWHNLSPRAETQSFQAFCTLSKIFLVSLSA